MIHKRSCSLSTKVNRDFYEMVIIRGIVIQYFDIFTVYKTLFQNVKKILPIIFQNKTKMPGKNRQCLVYL